MKRYGKLLTIVLAALLLCSFTISVSAADEYAEAATSVAALQLHVPDEDGIPALGKIAQKYQIAVLFAEAMTGKNNLSFWNTPAASEVYVDVPAYGGAVDYMAKRGILTGEGTEYGYTDTVSFQELLAVAVRVLGYEAEGMVYPQDYIFAAERLGLADNIITTSYTKAVTFGETMQLVWNMLCTEVAVYDSISGALLYPGEMGSMGDLGMHVERMTLLEENGFAFDRMNAILTEFIAADAADAESVDVVVLDCGIEIIAADLGITADTPKITYLGLPVSLYIDCMAEDFEYLYYNGEASIVFHAFEEYTTVSNLGHAGNIRLDVEQNDGTLFLGEDAFELSSTDVEIRTFSEDGWVYNADANSILRQFSYNVGYLEEFTHTYCQMAYRAYEAWFWDDMTGIEEQRTFLQILYTPYEFGQYIVRELPSAYTGKDESFTILGQYEPGYVSIDDECTDFAEYFVGSFYDVTTSKVSKMKGEAAMTVTVEGEAAESGDFVFYTYNPLDNVLTIAENWGKVQTGRLTGCSAARKTVKIDGVNYTVGFNGYMPLVEYDQDAIRNIIDNLEIGVDNVRFVAKDNAIAYYAPHAQVATVPQYGFAVVSFDAELMASLLGMTETKYANALTDGLYVKDGYVLAAVLNTENGKWHLGYIEGYALNYDPEECAFIDVVDVATMAGNVEIFGSAFVNAEQYEIAKAALTGSALQAVVSFENGAYTLANVDTEDFDGYYLVDRWESTNGLSFNSLGRTNAIKATSDVDVDAARVSTTADTVIVAIGADSIEVRTGVQTAANSLDYEATFFAASDVLIVLTTEYAIDGWGAAYKTEPSTPPSEDTTTEPEVTITPVVIHDPFAIVSTDVEIMAALLDITEAKYESVLVDGFYLTDDYVTVAMLDTEKGEWGIGYVDAVALEYDAEEGEFIDLVDVATMARYTEITSNINNADKYAAAKALLTENALLMVVSAENGVYTLASIDVTDGENLLVDRYASEGGLTFDADGKTNAIKATADVDVAAASVATTADTVLVAIGADSIEVRTGVQSPKRSLDLYDATFFSADSSLIVFTTASYVTGWGAGSDAMQDTCYLVLPEYSFEYSVGENEDEYTLVIEGLLDLRDFTVAEPIVLVDTFDVIADLADALEFGAVVTLIDGEFAVSHMDPAEAMAMLRADDDWVPAEVVEFIDGESITVKSGDTVITEAAMPLAGLQVQVVTLDFTGINWEHYDSEYLYVPVNYEEGVYSEVGAVEIYDVETDSYYEYFQYPLDTEEQDVLLCEPVTGIFSQFEADMEGRSVYGWMAAYEEWEFLFFPELFTVARYNEDLETLELCVLKILVPLEAETCTFGDWARYNAKSHARRCSCGMIELATHTYGEWKESVAATAESTGVKVRSCTVCGETQSAEIPALDVTVVTVDAPMGRVGSTVDVELSLRNGKGFGGMEFVFGFDAELLTLTAIEISDDFNGFTATPVEIAAESGAIAFCYADTQNHMGSGTVATLTFLIPEGTAEGTTAFTLMHEEDAAFYYDGTSMVDLILEIEEDVLQIRDYIPGDVNGDGTVSLRDAAVLLQSIARWDVEVREIAADVNCDEKINIRDVAMILQYLTGWDVVLGEAPEETDLLALFAAQAMNIKVSNAETTPGGTFSVDVAIADNSGFAGLDFSLCFDRSMLTLLSVDQTDALDAFTVTPVANANAKGEIVFCYVDLANLSGDGKIATLTFKVDPSAGGKDLLLAVMPPRDAFGISGTQLVDIFVFTENGTVTVTVPFGDVNSDGTIDVKDALLVLKALLNDTALAGGDVNNDGKISLLDVVRLLRIITG